MTLAAVWWMVVQAFGLLGLAAFGLLTVGAFLVAHGESRARRRRRRTPEPECIAVVVQHRALHQVWIAAETDADIADALYATSNLPSEHYRA